MFVHVRPVPICPSYLHSATLLPTRLNLVRLETRRSSLSRQRKSTLALAKSTQANSSMYNEQETTHRATPLQTRGKQNRRARASEADVCKAYEPSAPMSRNFCLISSFVSSERSERCKLFLRPPMMLRGGGWGGRVREESESAHSSTNRRNADAPVLVDRFLVRLGGNTTYRALYFELPDIVGLVLAGAATTTTDAIVLRFEVVQHSLGVLSERQPCQSLGAPWSYLTPRCGRKPVNRRVGKGTERRTWRVSFVNDLLCAAAL